MSSPVGRRAGRGPEGPDTGQSVPGESGVRPLLARGRAPGHQARSSANPEAPGLSQSPATLTRLFGPLFLRTMFRFLLGLVTSSRKMISKTPRQYRFGKSPTGKTMMPPRRTCEREGQWVSVKLLINQPVAQTNRRPRTRPARLTLSGPRMRDAGGRHGPGSLGPVSGLVTVSLTSQHAPRLSESFTTTTSHFGPACCHRNRGEVSPPHPVPHDGSEQPPRRHSGGDRVRPARPPQEPAAPRGARRGWDPGPAPGPRGPQGASTRARAGMSPGPGSRGCCH